MFGAKWITSPPFTITSIVSPLRSLIFSVMIDHKFRRRHLSLPDCPGNRRSASSKRLYRTRPCLKARCHGRVINT